MVATISSLAPLTINSTTIAVETTGFSPEIIAALAMHSGNLYASAQTVAGAAPRFTFRAFFQDIYALTGLTILSATTCSLYLGTFASLIRSASLVHTRLALAASCRAAIQIMGVATDQDGTLMADCEAVMLSNDGTTHPLALTTNNAYPALTAEPIKHTLGPCVLNGTGIPGVSGVSLSLNPTLIVQRTDGNNYPVVAAQVQGEPRLQIDHADPVGVLGATGLLGVNITSNIVQYFRRYNATTGVVGAADGVSFTIASGRAHPTAVGASQGAVATGGIEVAALSSSTTHPVAVSTSATVPAAG